MSTKSGRILRYSVDDPDDLRVLTESGVIWKSPYAQKAIDAIRSGAIDLAKCKNVPPQVASALGR